MNGDAASHPLAHRLLDWYQHNRRDLPWRNTKNPCHITVAEFMLHQTRVRTVLPYHQRFLERFADWASLAEASLDEVLKACEGLGYYARARNLRAAVQHLCLQYKAQLPDSEEAPLAPPGSGSCPKNLVTTRSPQRTAQSFKPSRR